MVDKKESLEKKVATREHIVTDQGNGGSFCSHCNYNLGSDPSRHYRKCPGCDYRLIEGGVYIGQGGSDF
ncbi:MAG: hypothetical protein KKF50_01405 [Nanoarchaeota archaeon]|nr:hypothetical protein [Nanoarchaeota archaeon]